MERNYVIVILCIDGQHVCMSVDVYVRSRISKTTRTDFTKISVCVVRSRCSILLGRRCNMLCTSGLVADVIVIIIMQRLTRRALQTVYWILAASKGWIKQTYRKIMHTQNHITGNDLVQIE